MRAEIKTLQTHELNSEVVVVVGTRPGIIMFAPIIHELCRQDVPHFIIHTGQHYSPNMDAQFFEDLELPGPEYRLQGVADKKTHGGQTAAMLEGIEKVLLAKRSCLVLVGGDANTNLAGALAARKLHIKVGHVEAGERSYDWRMPEEHNRVMIDHVSDYLFATGEKAVSNLKAESIRGEIHISGNPIVDASYQHLELAKRKSKVLEDFGLENGEFALMTSHREENVDVEENLRGALQGVSDAAQVVGFPVIFLAHPRTQKRLQEFGMTEWVKSLPGLLTEDAVRYLDFINLVAHAKLIFTDSGGVQQEAYIHRIPCVTLRDNTEWTETLETGANRLAGCDPKKISSSSIEALHATPEWKLPFGDGYAARRIVEVLKNALI